MRKLPFLIVAIVCTVLFGLALYAIAWGPLFPLQTVSSNPAAQEEPEGPSGHVLLIDGFSYYLLLDAATTNYLNIDGS